MDHHRGERRNWRTGNDLSYSLPYSLSWSVVLPVLWYPLYPRATAQGAAVGTGVWTLLVAETN
jgi:hypothetical protein